MRPFLTLVQYNFLVAKKGNLPQNATVFNTSTKARSVAKRRKKRISSKKRDDDCILRLHASQPIQYMQTKNKI